MSDINDLKIHRDTPYYLYGIFFNMIGKNWIKKYCCEDISLIENYDEAINDKTQIWHCHHKAEVLPCGRFSINDLKKFNLYYNRPANELIFLTKAQHNHIHKAYKNGRKNPNAVKAMRLSRLGVSNPHSEKTKKKIAEKLNQLYWFNNGIKSIRAKECPNGFVKGRIYKRKSI